MSYCLGKHKFMHRTPTVSWQKGEEAKEEVFAECLNCNELVKPGERYCSFFCRVEHQDK